MHKANLNSMKKLDRQDKKFAFNENPELNRDQTENLQVCLYSEICIFIPHPKKMSLDPKLELRSIFQNFRVRTELRKNLD